MEKLTGECSCGRVRYEIGSEVTFASMCHCAECRKSFGGCGSALGFFDERTFRWLRGREFISEYRENIALCLMFCRVCGTTLGCSLSDTVYCVTLGTLNGSVPITINEHYYVSDKADWDEIGGNAPQFPEGPLSADSKVRS